MNKHFATLGDVWKHLPLAEILRVNPPRHYWETHAGSAYYPLTPNRPRLHGALRFLAHAPNEPALQDCAYLEALRAMPGVYPGSPLLAARLLGQDAGYLFCDIDPESAVSLRKAMADYDARVVEADGVSAITREVKRARVDPADVMVLIDPFLPDERWTPGGRTPLELAGWLAGTGYRVFFWYCYKSAERRGWACDVIARLAPDAELWCGDTVMPNSFIYPERTGAFGCGVVLANATSAEMDVCERLGHGLERLGEGDLDEGNDPERLTFQVMGKPSR